ncbi:MAG TPA: gamma-glutamyl-gamma-aminobutyrate hydrolase family protein [Candidatus Limnocylindria bacterium]|jgi:putative glutamine amidotransferase|nr:gamma-glutamyl-gamma-aminobutyrate hydrolase family protein [Candidatus Limnocylindria bacterium]
MERPRIVVTLSNPAHASDPAVARLKNERYREAVERAGGEPVPVDDATPADVLATALDAMDGLVISGGADLDPALYGEAVDGSRAPDAARDALDLRAFQAAAAHAVPVLGICRGMQAINAFSGGTLVQHVEGHEGVPYLQGPAAQHPLRVIAGSRLSSVIGGQEATVVNSYHHQAVTADRLAPGLRAAAFAAEGDMELVEALEGRDPERWVVGIQCHPERTESSPLVLERLWSAFLAAAAAHRSSAAVEAG